MEVKDIIVISIIVFVLVVVGSFFGASPFIINNGIISPINPDASVKLDLHYAEGYFQSYSSPYTITIGAINTYYNVTNITVQSYKGITVADNQALIARDGAYKIIATMSFSGGNSGVYEAELFTNDVGHPECVFFRDTSSTARGDATFTCIEELEAGDKLNVRIKDISNPAQNINIYAFNFNIIEIP